MFRKTASLFLALTILILSASASAAFESGLFSKMIETEYTDERLAALDAAAENVSVFQTNGSITVEVSQAYYEGNRVFISYRATAPILEQDGLTLEDGTYADIMAGGSTELEDGSVIGWKECIVPEIRPAETFSLIYSIPGSKEKQSLSFTLTHHEYDQYLQGVMQSDAYRAQATLYRGKADLKGTVILTSPEQAASWRAWQEGEESNGTDVIACWNLYQNGEPVSIDLYGASEVLTDGLIFSVMFPTMEDLSGLTLVPEYSEAGEKPDEAIVLEPMEQE